MGLDAKIFIFSMLNFKPAFSHSSFTFKRGSLVLLHWLHQSLWLYGSQQTGKFLKRWEYYTILPASCEICMQVKKQQLEPDMKQQTDSKLGNEYKADVVTLLI